MPGERLFQSLAVLGKMSIYVRLFLIKCISGSPGRLNIAWKLNVNKVMFDFI